MHRSHRAAGLFTLALTLAVLACAVFAPAEAFAAALPAYAGHGGFATHLLDGMALAGPLALAGLRRQETDLVARAVAKAAEVVEGMAPEAARAVQESHGALLVELEAVRGEIRGLDAAAPPASTPSPVPAQADTAAAVRAERDRVTAITDLGTRAGIPAADIAAAIADATPIEAFRVRAFDALHEESRRTQSRPAATPTGALDETVTRRDAMVEYVLFRANKGPLTDRAREMYRGMDAVDLARETLNWKGERTRGLLPDEVAQRSLMSSSDFPAILAAGANKTLRQGYVAAPRTFKPWTRGIQLPDFKTYNIVRRGETPQLAKMNEKGEFKRGSISESRETIKLTTYGVVVGMTRQMIVNDDLGAFLGVPGDFGVSSASLESDLVYGAFLSNPALVTDNVAVFHATHKNLAASGAALGIASISAGRAAMAKMTGLDKKTVLNLTPAFLLVPPELETVAEQLLYSNILAAAAANVVPESIRSLKPISEARLSIGVSNADAGVTASGSATAHYLISTMVDTIVTATLEGQDGPYIETRMGFDVDGMEIKCRHDFAASAADFRGAYKDPGAAPV